MMRLFDSSRSPYVRKVLVAAHEIGVQDRFTVVRKTVAILKPDDEVIAANPPKVASKDVGLVVGAFLRKPDANQLRLAVHWPPYLNSGAAFN
jgi:hypothetical protein